MSSFNLVLKGDVPDRNVFNQIKCRELDHHAADQYDHWKSCLYLWMNWVIRDWFDQKRIQLYVTVSSLELVSNFYFRCPHGDHWAVTTFWKSNFHLSQIAFKVIDQPPFNVCHHYSLHQKKSQESTQNWGVQMESRGCATPTIELAQLGCGKPPTGPRGLCCKCMLSFNGNCRPLLWRRSGSFMFHVSFFLHFSMVSQDKSALINFIKIQVHLLSCCLCGKSISHGPLAQREGLKFCFSKSQGCHW